MDASAPATTDSLQGPPSQRQRARKILPPKFVDRQLGPKDIYFPQYSGLGVAERLDGRALSFSFCNHLLTPPTWKQCLRATSEQVTEEEAGTWNQEEELPSRLSLTSGNKREGEVASIPRSVRRGVWALLWAEGAGKGRGIIANYRTHFLFGSG